jgi:tetratricopeptide (TPR) repeat protein
LTVAFIVTLAAPRHRLLLAAGLVAAALMAHAADPAVPASASDDKLRQIIGRAQAQPTAAQAGNPAVLTAKTVAPERLQERADLLASGEQALARRDVDAALQAFDRAALILHAADTEIALVRAYMQGGEYRRALAFGAHTAGAHLDVVGGSALYAWLLHVGGQNAVAQRLLDEAQSRLSPNQATNQAADPMVNLAASQLLGAVQGQLRSGRPLADSAMLSLPTRLAPYGSSAGLPKTARMVGSGFLLQSGQEALVPLTLVPRTGRLWVRNGLGELVGARIVQRLPIHGVALLRLGSALPVAQDLWAAERDAFPGSVGYAAEFVVAPDAAPAWPVLRTGFLGGTSSDGALRLLGIDMPHGRRTGPSSGSYADARGGPVFDTAGRLLGVALSGKPGAPDRLVTASALPIALRLALAHPAPKDANARYGIDKIYEISLKNTLQVIALP